jgi:hypothetical protein
MGRSHVTDSVVIGASALARVVQRELLAAAERERAATKPLEATWCATRRLTGKVGAIRVLFTHASTVARLAVLVFARAPNVFSGTQKSR